MQIQSVIKEPNLSLKHLNVDLQRSVLCDLKRRIHSVDGGSVPGRNLPHSKTKVFQTKHDELVS